MEITRMHGIGCEGLCNTNHWMRGGYFGWMAAEAGLSLMRHGDVLKYSNNISDDKVILLFKDVPFCTEIA